MENDKNAHRWSILAFLGNATAFLAGLIGDRAPWPAFCEAAPLRPTD